MPTDLLSLDLRAARPHDWAAPPRDADSTIRSLHDDDRAALADLYYRAYPPGVAVESRAEAVAEINATFASEFGLLRQDATAVEVRDSSLVGAVLVVERSIWDVGLDGPFIIDLFVDPAARGLGVGATLLAHTLAACCKAADKRLSLRAGEGTSAAAHRLYDGLGFQPYEPR